MAQMTDKKIVDWIMSCRREADEAKRERMSMNKDNYDMYHLKQNFSHKSEGQTTEVLSKVAMSVEQIRSIFQQALVNMGDWWSAESETPSLEEGMLIKPHEITKLTTRQLEKANYYSHVGNSVQSALLASLAISKTYGALKDKPRFVVKKKGRGKTYKKWLEKIEDKTWQLKFDCVRAENYFPDPTGKGLYEIEDMWLDLHEVKQLAEGKDAIYDKALVDQLSGGQVDPQDEQSLARETGQSIPAEGHRPKVKITEFWGTIIDPHSGEVCYENCVATIANDTHLIRQPEPNPLWHQRSPYNASPLTEVANSVWHKALMDAPTQHNKSLNELYNLLVDAAFAEVHAIKQLRKYWLDDPAQVSDGIEQGATLTVNSMCPPTAKVIEPLSTVTVPTDAFNIYNIMQQEYNASALTSDARAGITPMRAQSATATVEGSQTITSVFEGMSQNFEARQIQRELELAWMTTAQNWQYIAKDEFVALFGEARGAELHALDPEDVFAATVNGIKFRVYGISMTLAKSQDYQKLMTMIQTVFSNPALTEEFMKKYSPALLLGETLTSLDIDKYKLEIPAAVQATMQPAQEEGAPIEGPDMNSQTPQASAMSDMMGAEFPQGSFPGNGALPGMDMGGPQ